ncbi:MAG TPA: DMT family transporter [Chloroflexi bacterium]|jgi:drug/metabolite transporter (DMT)-like permease|nr:DMT family transporter [Chloroflexota bacterium]
MDRKKSGAILYAFLAAAFYAINMPLSKLLLQKIEPTFMAALLYLGAGIGISIIFLFRKQIDDQEEQLSRKELPYVIGMILLDVAAPIFLMIGLTSATSANASLLNNFEIVATSLIALFIFKELISPRLWIAILLITFSSMLLSFEDMSSLTFSLGSVFVLAAALCWGFENNLTRKISSKNTFQIVMLKGIFSGLGSLLIALFLGERFPQLQYVLLAMLLGFVAYGLSIFLYVRAQKDLGAAKTSAYYAVAPFIGALLSFLILKEAITDYFLVAFLIMTVGSVLVVIDTMITRHSHLHTHTFTEIQNGTKIRYQIEHSHEHKHFVSEKHSHQHKNE